MRYFETRKARIEIIPMIDIMLFLLVFFAMMTLRMIPTTGHVSKLPASSTATAMPSPKLLVEIRTGGCFMSKARAKPRLKSRHWFVPAIQPNWPSQWRVVKRLRYSK